MPKIAPRYSFLWFLILCLSSLTIVSYVIIFINLNEQRLETSRRGFEDVYYNISEHMQHGNYQIEDIFATHINTRDVSYRLMLITPSGQPFIHTHRRPDQLKQDFFTLPYWRYPDGVAKAFSIDQTQLLGWAKLPNHYELYVQIIHPPLPIKWTHPAYWLPLITALILFFWGCYLILVYKMAWQHLISYTNSFPTRLHEPYRPMKDKELEANQEFQRMAHSLNRLNQQLHQLSRRSQILEKRLNRFNEYAPLPMLMMNRKGDISYFNRCFEQMFMAVFQENVSYHITDFLMGKDRATQQIIAQLGGLRISQTLNVSSLQNSADYLLHLSPWTGRQGQVQGFCAQLTNVSHLTSELKEIYLKFQQQADRLIEFDKLWSVLGHELRTPLSGMIGLLELMDTDNFNSDQLETYTTLTQTSQTMLTMLNDMLDVAKMDAGKLQVVIERTDLLALCHQVADLMASNARNNNIELLLYFDPQCPRYIDTDPGRIRQALMNLLGNAIKFTQAGYVALLVSKLDRNSASLKQLASATHHLSPQKLEEDWLCFKIKDTGIGISPEDKAKLFTHFSQANESISRQFGGTGLGLAISNNFAQMLGGFIHVESAIGQGSEFSLYLPLKQISYQPVYHFNVNLADICLIAFSSQQISTEALQTLADYLGFACLAYTGIYQKDIDKIGKIDLTQFIPIILVEEELYDTYELEPVFNLPCVQQAPKILLSMRPEAAISSERRERYDVFLTKPLTVNHLVKQLISLSISSQSDNDDEHSYLSKTQRAFNAFMTELNLSNKSKQNPSVALDPDNKHQSSADDDLAQVQTDAVLTDAVLADAALADTLATDAPVTDATTDATTASYLGNAIADKPTQNGIQQDRANQNKLTQDTANQDSIEQDHTNQNSIKQDNMRQDKGLTQKGSLILVAEDDPINQKVACKVLAKLGYRSVTANNGEQALAVLAEYGDAIGLILMDCQMPVLNGFETTEYIRNTKNTIPIIALTANDTDADREECLAAGMNGFLSKPIRKDKLTPILDKFMLF